MPLPPYTDGAVFFGRDQEAREIIVPVQLVPQSVLFVADLLFHCLTLSPKLLQERLGHERIQTTLDTYGHLYPNAQAEVARKLEAFMAEG